MVQFNTVYLPWLPAVPVAGRRAWQINALFWASHNPPAIHMRPQVALLPILWLCVFLSGCVTTPGSDTDNVPPTPLPPLDRRTIEAETGHANRIDFGLPPTQRGRFVEIRSQIQLANPRPGQGWTSTMALCVSSLQPEPEACLRFAKYKSTETVYADGLYQSSAKSKTETTELKGDLPLTEPIDVVVSLEGETVRFEIGNGEAYEVALGAIPKKIGFGCSSATCSVQFREPIQRPVSERKPSKQPTSRSDNFLMEYWDSSLSTYFRQPNRDLPVLKVLFMLETLPYIQTNTCKPLRVVEVRAEEPAQSGTLTSDSTVREVVTYAACGELKQFVVEVPNK